MNFDFAPLGNRKYSFFVFNIGMYHAKIFWNDVNQIVQTCRHLAIHLGENYINKVFSLGDHRLGKKSKILGFVVC